MNSIFLKQNFIIDLFSQYTLKCGILCVLSLFVWKIRTFEQYPDQIQTTLPKKVRIRIKVRNSGQKRGDWIPAYWRMWTAYNMARLQAFWWVGACLIAVSSNSLDSAPLALKPGANSGIVQLCATISWSSRFWVSLASSPFEKPHVHCWPHVLHFTTSAGPPTCCAKFGHPGSLILKFSSLEYDICGEIKLMFGTWLWVRDLLCKTCLYTGILFTLNSSKKLKCKIDWTGLYWMGQDWNRLDLIGRNWAGFS